jgi:hypothetical protein
MCLCVTSSKYTVHVSSTLHSMKHWKHTKWEKHVVNDLKVKLNSKHQFSNCTLQIITMWMKHFWLDTKNLLSLPSIWDLHEVRDVGEAPSIKWEKQYIYKCFHLNWNKYQRNNKKKSDWKKDWYFDTCKHISWARSTVSNNTTFLHYTTHTYYLTILIT